jgi:nitrile hydratase
MVAQPRALLAEMGLTLPDHVRIRVWDSSAEARYLVVPERPPDTEHLGQADLVRLVTRDAMIGVARALNPDQIGADGR